MGLLWGLCWRSFRKLYIPFPVCGTSWSCVSFLFSGCEIKAHFFYGLHKFWDLNNMWWAKGERRALTWTRGWYLVFPVHLGCWPVRWGSRVTVSLRKTESRVCLIAKLMMLFPFLCWSTFSLIYHPGVGDRCILICIALYRSQTCWLTVNPLVEAKSWTHKYFEK